MNPQKEKTVKLNGSAVHAKAPRPYSVTMDITAPPDMTLRVLGAKLKKAMEEINCELTGMTVGGPRNKEPKPNVV